MGVADVISFVAVVKLKVPVVSFIVPVLPVGKTYFHKVARFKK